MYNKFLGLPVLTTNPSFYAFIRHVLSILLFSALWYFILAIGYGALRGDAWMYIESTKKHIPEQTVFLVLGTILNIPTRALLNRAGDRFFHFPKFDYFLYVIGLIIAFLSINEIGGF